MVVGAGCFVTGFMQHVACWVFLVGAVMFTLMQSMQTYEGRNIAIRRLRRIMSLANILFLLSGILMVDTVYHFLLPDANMLGVRSIKEQKKALYESIRDENGRVRVDAVEEAINEIMTAVSEDAEGKNS